MAWFPCNVGGGGEPASVFDFNRIIEEGWDGTGETTYTFDRNYDACLIALTYTRETELSYTLYTLTLASGSYEVLYDSGIIQGYITYERVVYLKVTNVQIGDTLYMYNYGDLKTADIAEIYGKIIIIEDLIPRMTSDTTPKGECSSSYVYSGRYAYYGFTTLSNGSTSHASEFWYNNAADNWIQYEFDEPVTVFEVSFGTIEDETGSRFKFQFSTDGTTWTDDETRTLVDGNYTHYKLSNPVYCKYFRIYCIDLIYVISGIRAYGIVGQYNPTKELVYELQAGGQWETFTNPEPDNGMLCYDVVDDNTDDIVLEVRKKISECSVYGNYTTIGTFVDSYNSTTYSVNVSRTNNSDTIYISINDVCPNYTIKVYTYND